MHEMQRLPVISCGRGGPPGAVGAGLPALCSHWTGSPANAIKLSRHSGRECQNPVVANQVTRKSWVSYLNPAYTYGLF